MTDINLNTMPRITKFDESCEYLCSKLLDMCLSATYFTMIWIMSIIF
jgi:hypothetical protein